MLRVIVVSVLLVMFGVAVVALAVATPLRPQAFPAHGHAPASLVQAQAALDSGAGLPCPPIGTEGPPERELAQAITCAEPAPLAPTYCEGER